MKKTKVVHCKRDKYDVYIGRPSKWGNPFTHKSGANVAHVLPTREEAVAAYEQWILNQPELLNDLHEIEGKTLGCWRKPNSCHGDVLVKLIENRQNMIPQGLYYIEDYITHEQEQELLGYVDSMQWSNELKRRVQHYGYKYNYKNRSVSKDDYLGEIPFKLNTINFDLHSNGYTPYLFDQLIVNEYVGSQGISKHIDCVNCFEDYIISVTLGSGVAMKFRNGDSEYEIYLKPRSLVVLSGDARYKWTHDIPIRSKDKFGEETIDRGRRVSLTFRKVKLQ